MQLIKKPLVFLFLTFLVSGALHAADKDKKMEAFKEKATAKLKKVNPEFKIGTVSKTPLAGFYAIQVDNGPLIYMTADGNHFFDGTLYDITNDDLVNVTALEEAKQRKDLVKEFNPAEMIVFSPAPPQKAKAVINVFTDVDCYYCQKLHQEVPELNKLGIEVRYLAFPRAGIGSKSYDKVVSAWCAKDPQDSLTKLKARQEIPPATCNNPVEKQYKLGKRMGVTGTPAIILQDGVLIPGYKPAAKLAKQLGI